jgi:biopolymer transport protein ExbB/TolQ
VSDTTTWLAIGISAASLAISGTVAVLAERRRRRAERTQKGQEKELADLRHKQQLTELRQIIQRLITKWRNSHLKDPWVVTDDNWRALLDSVKEWRKGLFEDQTALLAYTDTDEGKTRPFFLLERTVQAAKAFERAVQPIVERWDPPPQGVDPYQDKQRVQAAIGELQAEFHKALDELEDIRGEDLVKPAGDRAFPDTAAS